VNKRTPSHVILEGQCAGPLVCPLTRVKAGAVVCIKQLSAAPEIRARLREMGLCEKQTVKLLSRHSNVICQVCNARLGISKGLAESILVEALPAHMEAA
jgi:Fe2+ transport system protein FeoA